MIRIIYFIILAYFILGAVGFYFINRKKEPAEANKSWTKFIAYAVIIHILFFSIVINPLVFRYLSVLILLTGFYELFKLFKNAGYTQKKVFLLTVIFFIVFAFGFFLFSGMKKERILFSFLMVSVFDSFSQITGQLWGRKKIFPKISPQKTVGGAVGGALVALLSTLLFNGLVDEPLPAAILLATGIVVFAFAGDVLSSTCKRKYKVKDFSKLIPGHGGMLDRFDSLIAGGAWVALSEYLMYF